VIGYGLKNGEDILIYDPSKPSTPGNVERVIDVMEDGGDITIDYRWSSAKVFTRMCALTYEEDSLIERFWDWSSDALWVFADCPVSMSLVDPNGHQTGASYSDGENHLIVELEPTFETYEVRLEGTADGDYSLVIETERSGEVERSSANGTIEKGQTVVYDLSVSGDGQSLERTEDTDGTFDLVLMLMVGTIVVVIVATSAYGIRRSRRRGGTMPSPPPPAVGSAGPPGGAIDQRQQQLPPSHPGGPTPIARQSPPQQPAQVPLVQPPQQPIPLQRAEPEMKGPSDMFCSSCGSPFEGDSRFCIMCGKTRR
jgi:hypothetical protein